MRCPALTAAPDRANCRVPRPHDVHELFPRAEGGQGAGDAQGISDAHGGHGPLRDRSAGRGFLLPVAHHAGEGREVPRPLRRGVRACVQGPGAAPGRADQGHPGRVAEAPHRQLPHRGGEEADRGDGRLRQVDGDAAGAHAPSRRATATRKATRTAAATAATSRSAPTAITPRASASARTRAATARRSRSGTSASTRTSTTRSSSAPATSRSRCGACASSPASASRTSWT